MRRLEDPDLLTGRGRFVDDITLPDMLEAAFVRSPHAHAAIRGIDATVARAAPGVHAVFTLADFKPHLTTTRLAVALPSPAIKQVMDRPVLADDEVVHVGEPVAIVIAESRYLAEDAAALVDVDYEPLPVAADCRDALAAGAPRAHRGGAQQSRRRIRPRLRRSRRPPLPAPRTYFANSSGIIAAAAIRSNAAACSPPMIGSRTG